MDDALHAVPAMTRSLRHRGPDATGGWRKAGVALGATRLAILDPAAGAQPVVGSREDLCLAFNGEIYNHAELRRGLQRRGVRFTSQTDTEVLLRLYEAEGIDCIDRLRGMFAFAIVDGEKLILARDRLGIKPVFYASATRSRHGQVFGFASEIKALLRYPDFGCEMDTQAFADTLLIGHPTGEATLFGGIRSLPPGHTLTVELGPVPQVGQPRRYASPPADRDDAMTLDEAQERVEQALRAAVASHLVADVEVALTLSGGLDSTLLALFACELQGRPPRTFTVGDHAQNADVSQAAQLARSIGASHEHLSPSFEEYLACIPSVVAAEEHPSSLHTVPLWLLCRRVAGHAKACLNGEGADEMFGGYSDYLNRAPRLAHIQAQLPALRHFGVPPSDRALQIVERLSSPSTFEAYLPAIFAVNLEDALERQHLNPLDRCSMASSLEMRVPFLDDAMVELQAKLPLRHLVRSDIMVRKYLLRRIALKCFGQQVVDVVLREKVGAPVSGVVSLDRFDQLCERSLPDAYVSQHEFGRCFGSKRRLLVFDLFRELFFAHRGEVDAMGSVQDFIAARAGVPAREVRAS